MLTLHHHLALFLFCTMRGIPSACLPSYILSYILVQLKVILNVYTFINLHQKADELFRIRSPALTTILNVTSREKLFQTQAFPKYRLQPTQNCDFLNVMGQQITKNGNVKALQN